VLGVGIAERLHPLAGAASVALGSLEVEDPHNVLTAHAEGLGNFGDARARCVGGPDSLVAFGLVYVVAGGER
jgi:hypothetical protein